MPKDWINSRYEGQDSVTTDSSGAEERTPIEETRLRVGWDKGHSLVQIATVAPPGHMLEQSDLVGDESNGWFLTLDRAGINRLIRTLRLARDQAFGKDA